MGLKVEAELNDSIDYLNQVRSIFMMDEVKDFLTSKGLTTTRSPSGSEAQREDALLGYQPYIDALRRKRTLETFKKYFAIKQNAFYNAYNSVKKILSVNRDNMPGQQLNIGTVSETPGFGTPKY